MHRLVLVARYVALRSVIARRYEATALDDILRSLDRAGSPASLRDVLFAIRQGERVARRARLGLDTCLFRALSRYALLRWAGHAPRFVMGVDEHDSAKGHAWVELNGTPVLEPPLTGMCRTLEYPPRA